MAAGTPLEGKSQQESSSKGKALVWSKRKGKAGKGVEAMALSSRKPGSGQSVLGLGRRMRGNEHKEQQSQRVCLGSLKVLTTALVR